MAPLEFETLDGVPTAETINQPGVLEWALGKWQAGRGGPLASGIRGTSFLPYTSILADVTRSALLQAANEELEREALSGPQQKLFELRKQVFLNDKGADAQFVFQGTGFNPYSGDRLSGLFQHEDPENYVGVAVILGHPFSRGSSHITSSDSKAHPRIDPRYLSNPIDLSVMADSILFIQGLFKTKPLADFVKDSPDGNGKKIQPSFQIDKKLDRAGALEFVKKAAISSWHPIGTCAMPPNEDGGVVDERLRVYGVKNLRVVDASIIPLHIRGNIASAVYAIAEKAADMIKEDFKSKAWLSA
jgi:choline dehydrogenase